MKNSMRHSVLYLVTITCIILVSCQKKDSDDSSSGQPVVETSPNQILYEEVMDIHDEVMPKMSAIYLQKRRLSLKLDSVSSDKKAEIQTAIQQLDSASEEMNIWMQQFQPKPDSTGVEEAREYLEDQMIKVKKVKVDMIESLDNAAKL